MDLDGPVYGGERFPVRSTLGGRLFVSFHVDVAVGDVLLMPLAMITGEDWLGFAGIRPSPLTTTSLEQQFSEKIHAYTMPARAHATIAVLRIWSISCCWSMTRNWCLKMQLQQLWQHSNTEALTPSRNRSLILRTRGRSHTQPWRQPAASTSILMLPSFASKTTTAGSSLSSK